MLVEKKNRLAKAQKPAWPSLFSAQQEKDEMDAFLDDIKDVEDKADVAVPQPFWKQDSWKTCWTVDLIQARGPDRT